MAHLGLPMPERFVTADDVSKGKPHPEAYLKGAEILKTRREACVVVEDAPLGIRAARVAGVGVVAPATTSPLDDLHEADVVAPAPAKSSDLAVPGRRGPRFELSVPGCQGGQEEMMARWD